MSNYNSQLQSNNTDLQTVLQTLQIKAAGGEQATPVISVNASGLITATAGAKSSTHQLAFQPAKTITPSTASQIAVSSGYYTGGNITVLGDSNLVASNIKSGVSIFGVSGTLVEGSGGGSGEQADWSANEDAIITGTISSYFNDRVTTIYSNAFRYYDKLISINFPSCQEIAQCAFAYCDNLTNISFPACKKIHIGVFEKCDSLTKVDFPNCTTIYANAFLSCYSLTTANFPNCITIHDCAFSNCYSLSTISFPNLATISNSVFMGCSSLKTVDIPNCAIIGHCAFYDCVNLTTINTKICNTIGSWAFTRCKNLSELYLAKKSVCTLENSNAFNLTPYNGYSSSFSGTPYIYVPASLVSAYQSATNWAYFSSYFKAAVDIEDEPSDIRIINFTIDGTEYQAEEGMTWTEWCDSEYNVLGLYDDGYDIVCGEGPMEEYIWDQDYNDGMSGKPIIENYHYILSA